MSKKAFLVGINDYAPSGPNGPDLRGCVNDVEDMADTLEHFSFRWNRSRSR
jgi:metacaspase-1